ARDPAVPALRRRPRVHPGRGAAVQRVGGELQRLVPGAAVPTALPAAGRPAPGTDATPGSGQHAARPPAAAWPDAGPAPPGPAAPETARNLRRADGQAAVGGGACDLHP